jgi:hypothetical protein
MSARMARWLLFSVHVVRFDSCVRIRKPSIMFVGIEPGTEPWELGPDQLGAAVNVLRVRHALPACQRMRHLRPSAVIVGASVRSWALPFLQQAARESGAVMLQLGPLVARGALSDWLLRVLEHGQQARDEGGDGDAPSVARGRRR